MHLAPWIIYVIAAVVFVALVIVLMALQYRKVGPNEALIISGGRKRTVTLAEMPSPSPTSCADATPTCA